MSEQEQMSQLSALFDNELPPAQAELVIRRVLKDPALRASWGRYALIGACVRGEPLAVALPQVDVAARIRARLAVRAGAGEYGRCRLPIPTASTAAQVIAVAARCPGRRHRRQRGARVAGPGAVDRCPFRRFLPPPLPAQMAQQVAPREVPSPAGAGSARPRCWRASPRPTATPRRWMIPRRAARPCSTTWRHTVTWPSRRFASRPCPP